MSTNSSSSFTLQEQKRLLMVGACLQCHKDTSKVMRQAIETGLEPILKEISEKCIMPKW